MVHDIGVKENNLVVSYTNKLGLTMFNTLEPWFAELPERKCVACYCLQTQNTLTLVYIFEIIVKLIAKSSDKGQIQFCIYAQPIKLKWIQTNI